MTTDFSNIIGKSFLFADIPYDKWETYLPQMDVITYAYGETIISKNLFKKALGIILIGKVSVLKNNSLLLTTLATGECFGVAGIFSPVEEYVTTIIAKTPVSIAYLSPTLLEKIFADIPRTAIQYISFLSDKINFLNEKIDAFTAPTTEISLESWISQHQVDGVAVVTEGYTTLAKKLNMGRASLYRALDALASQGKITRDKKSIYLLQLYPQMIKE